MIFPKKFYTKKSKTTLKWQYRLVGIVLLIFLPAIFHQPILIGLAKKLDMPSSELSSDVVFVDGGDVISKLSMEKAIDFYKAGKARSILLTLSPGPTAGNVYALRNYRELVKESLAEDGVPDSAYAILFFDVGDPYTHSLAESLVVFLLENNYHSISIIQDNFHIKRSYLAFKKVMDNHGIAVRPVRLEIYMNAKNWWLNTNGVRRVYGEYYKLFYYWLKGYI